MANHTPRALGLPRARRATGGELTVQSTGIGGAERGARSSASSPTLGVRRAVRIGTLQRARRRRWPPASRVVARSRVCRPTASAARSGAAARCPTPALDRALAVAAPGATPAAVASSDLDPEAPGPRPRRRVDRGRRPPSPTCRRAALLALGARLGRGGRRRRWWSPDRRRGRSSTRTRLEALAARARRRRLQAALGAAAERGAGGRGSPRSVGAARAQLGELVAELVEPVLDRLEALGERAQPLLEPLDVGGRGMLRAPIACAGPACALAGAQRPARAPLKSGFSSSAWASSPTASSPRARMPLSIAQPSSSAAVSLRGYQASSLSAADLPIERRAASVRQDSGFHPLVGYGSSRRLIRCKARFEQVAFSARSGGGLAQSRSGRGGAWQRPVQGHGKRDEKQASTDDRPRGPRRPASSRAPPARASGNVVGVGESGVQIDLPDGSEPRRHPGAAAVLEPRRRRRRRRSPTSTTRTAPARSTRPSRAPAAPEPPTTPPRPDRRRPDRRRRPAAATTGERTTTARRRRRRAGAATAAAASTVDAPDGHRQAEPPAHGGSDDGATPAARARTASR